MPKTDFEAFYPSDDDIPSEMDVFNEDNKYHAKQEREKRLQKELEAAHQKILRAMRGETEEEKKKDEWS